MLLALLNLLKKARGCCVRVTSTGLACGGLPLEAAAERAGWWGDREHKEEKKEVRPLVHVSARAVSTVLETPRPLPST